VQEGIIHIKYNESNLHRFNVKVYKYLQHKKYKCQMRLYNLVALRNFMILILLSWSGPSASGIPKAVHVSAYSFDSIGGYV